MQVPAPLQSLFSHFPLYAHPPLHAKSRSVLTNPTIWVHSSNDPDAVLSSDVECLKWQAYLALRGLNKIQVRFDVDAQGAIDGRLPNLHVPFDADASYSWTANKKASSTGPIDDSTELLAAHHIVEWVDMKLAHSVLDDAWEGYRDERAKDESRAWVSLLEGNVHAALILSQPSPSLWESLLLPARPSASLGTTLVPPPPPSTGFLSLLPSYTLTIFSPFGSTSNNSGFKITSATRQSVFAKYAEAITALSERLGTDKWFLGSEYPTPLDALIFAYLHCILHSSESLRTEMRTEVTRRVNLVAWERRVQGIVKGAFVKPA